MKIRNWRRCEYVWRPEEVMCWNLNLKNLKDLLREYSYRLVIETDDRKPKRYWLILKRYRDFRLENIEHILDEAKLYEAKERAKHFMRYINSPELLDKWWYDINNLKERERESWYRYLKRKL